jgi:hypothetical protein
VQLLSLNDSLSLTTRCGLVSSPTRFSAALQEYWKRT